MALGVLFLLFISLSVLGAIGIAFMFISKSDGVKTFCLFALTVLALVIMFLGVTSLPTNDLAHRALAIGIGLIAVAGVVVKLKMKADLCARLLVAASVAIGIVELFLV